MEKPFSKVNRKSILLSVVALILAVCMLSGVTYSWIETVTKISVVTTRTMSRRIKKISSATDSVVNVTSGDEVIDIGSYFNTSGNMHLTACSGDGKNFYFKSVNKENGDSFRRGTANDMNVNYISCTFKLNSTKADTALWLNELPTLFDGETDLSQYLRCAVTVDGTTTVIAKNGNYKAVKNSAGETGECSAIKPDSYMWECDAENGKGSTKCLFYVEKGETKTVNVKMWLEDPSSKLSINTHNLSLKMSLVTTLSKQTVYFKDHTFSEDGINLATGDAENTDSIFYMCLADSPETFWAFSSQGEDGVYKVEISIIHRNKKVYILRCDDVYGEGSKKIENSSICYDYKWNAVLPMDGEDATYSVLGEISNGFWGDSVRVNCDDQYGIDLSKTKMLLTDLDAVTGRYMYYDQINGYWCGYVKSDSKKIKFTAENGSSDTLSWGYCDNTGNQKKPKDADTYTIYDKADGSWDTDEAVSLYELTGDFNDWKGSPMLYSNKAENITYTALELEKGTYSFEIFGNDKWYGDGKTYSVGAGGTTKQSSSLSAAENKKENSTVLDVKAEDGGTVLFVFDGSKKSLTIEFVPTLPVDNQIRNYITVNADFGDEWLSYINHWEAEVERRNVTYVSKLKMLDNNCYVITDSKTEKAQGDWMYLDTESDSLSKIYFKPDSDWTKDNAKFGVQFYNDSAESGIILMNKDSDSRYSVKIPEGDWKNAVFVRLNSTVTEATPEWNSNNVLNETESVKLSKTTYNLYYADMEQDSQHMQWVSEDNAQYIPDDSQFEIDSSLSGNMYYLKDWNGDGYEMGTLNGNIQRAPDMTVDKTNVQVGETVTFGAGKVNSGTAYKGGHISYYVTSPSGTTRLVNSEWTPNRAGEYTVFARADDGFITTSDVSNPITITVN